MDHIQEDVDDPEPGVEDPEPEQRHSHAGSNTGQIEDGAKKAETPNLLVKQQRQHKACHQVHRHIEKIKKRDTQGLPEEAVFEHTNVVFDTDEVAGPDNAPFGQTNAERTQKGTSGEYGKPNDPGGNKEIAFQRTTPVEPTPYGWDSSHETFKWVVPGLSGKPNPGSTIWSD